MKLRREQIIIILVANGTLVADAMDIILVAPPNIC